MVGGGRGRAALLVAVAWCAAATIPGPLLAQSQQLPPRNADPPVSFDIPAQPLARALNAWAVQANAQLFVDPGPVAHLRAPALKATLPPRQALRALLAHSNLEITQGQDGVFVIRPRRPLAAAKSKTATPLSAAPAAAVVTVPVATTAMPESPWLLRIAATYLADTGSARSGGSVLVGSGYRLSDRFAIDLSATLPRTHSFDGGSARVQSTTLGARYNFAPGRPLRPYVGAGLDITVLSADRGIAGLSRVTAGPAVQAGLDLVLGTHWMLDADVSWAQVRPGVAAASSANIHIDPLQIGLGVVYRF